MLQGTSDPQGPLKDLSEAYTLVTCELGPSLCSLSYMPEVVMLLQV